MEIHVSCRCEDLAARVRTLEGQRRRQEGLCVAVCCGLAALLFGGAIRGVPESIEAQRFVLRDSSGKVRATLGPEQLGYGGIDTPSAYTSVTALRLLDRSGALRAQLEASWDWADEDPASYGSLSLPSRQSREIRRGLALFSSPGIRMDSDYWTMDLSLQHTQMSEPAMAIRQTYSGFGRGISIEPHGVKLFDDKGAPVPSGR